MKISYVKILGIVFLFGLSLMTTAHGKTCSQQEAEEADAMVDQLDSWSKVNVTFKKFRQCDDGSIAEGNSEAVARLLVDQWDTLPLLSKLIIRNPSLKLFVLRHIDTTLNSDDLEKIKKLSSSACPKEMIMLCNDIKIAATHALK